MKKKNLMVMVLSGKKQNKKVNLGGPGITKKKTHGSVNRNMLKTKR
jgi:ATP-dependent RNA helicase RhlE